MNEHSEVNDINQSEVPQPIRNPMIIGIRHNCENSKGRICFTIGKLFLKPQSRERLKLKIGKHIVLSTNRVTKRTYNMTG